jgi:hypothetical protein
MIFEQKQGCDFYSPGFGSVTASIYSEPGET